MKNLGLSDAETAALIDLLKRSIVVDRYPLSPRVRTLVGILGKPEPARATLTANGSLPRLPSDPDLEGNRK